MLSHHLLLLPAAVGGLVALHCKQSRRLSLQIIHNIVTLGDLHLVLVDSLCCAVAVSLGHFVVGMKSKVVIQWQSVLKRYAL